MIEVLYGTKYELINKYIKEYISKKNVEYIKYDYELENLSDFINELMYVDLFNNEKVVVLNNANFLTSKSTLDNEIFNNYIDNPNKTISLFLVVNEEKIDDRKKIVKALKSKYVFKEFNSFNETDAFKYINNYFKNIDYKISNEAVKKIYEYLGNLIEIYDSELNKLYLYKYNEKEIDVNDVIKIITKMPEEDIFKLTDAIIVKDKEDMFNIYKEMKENGLDEIALVALLANQFRFLYSVKVLMDDGKNKYDISSTLSSHPYRTELTMKKITSTMYRKEEILNILYKISLLDENFKTKGEDKRILIENFFLEI